MGQHFLLNIDLHCRLSPSRNNFQGQEKSTFVFLFCLYNYPLEIQATILITPLFQGSMLHLGLVFHFFSLHAGNCRRASSGREGIHSKNRSIILYLLIIKTHFCPRQRLVYPVQFLLPVLGGQKSHFTQAQMILLASLIYLPKSKKNLFKNPFSVMYTEAPKIQSSPCKRD